MEKIIMYFVVTVVVCLISCMAMADCNKQQMRKDANSRFIIVGGEAFDKTTKLTWSRCSVGVTWKKGVGCVGSPKMMNLNEANNYAKKIGHGWRVPTINELKSIADGKCNKPIINTIAFPDIKDRGEGAPYWSITQVEQMPMLYYYVDFINGIVDGHSSGFGLAVRLVRSQQ